MDTNNTFPQEDQTEPKLNTSNKDLTPSQSDLRLNMHDVKNLAILKFGGVNAFGKALGVTKGMASVLLSGQYVPLREKTIKRIADCLGIDALQLSHIYSELKQGGKNE
jgi:hypothetical protein